MMKLTNNIHNITPYKVLNLGLVWRLITGILLCKGVFNFIVMEKIFDSPELSLLSDRSGNNVMLLINNDEPAKLSVDEFYDIVKKLTIVSKIYKAEIKLENYDNISDI